MAILSAQTIRKYCLNYNMVYPFVERTKNPIGLSYGLGPAGYDVRLDQFISLEPKEFSLGSTLERFSIPTDILARVQEKSTWARQGLSLFNTVIEPGWSGFLTLELFNSGNTTIHLFKNDPIAQIIFEKLDHPTDHPYEDNGKYQNQMRGPQVAR